MSTWSPVTWLHDEKRLLWELSLDKDFISQEVETLGLPPGRSGMCEKQDLWGLILPCYHPDRPW